MNLLFLDGQTKLPADGGLESAPAVSDLTAVAATLREGQRYLEGLPVDAVVEWLDAAARQWLDAASPVQRKFAPHGINFLLTWLRATHLRDVLDLSLRGNRECLDGFAPIT